MKVLKRDLRHDMLKLLVENIDDLWHLHHVIEPHDELSGRTFRRVQSRGPEEGRGEKRPMFLKIAVERIEYHEFANILRVTGPITEGPPDASLGSYHTFGLAEGAVFTLFKPGRWGKYHLERIQTSTKLRKKVLVVIVEPGEATLALVHAYGVRMLGTVATNLPSKRNDPEGYTTKERDFYGEVVKGMAEAIDSHEPSGTIIAGPGWAKDKLAAVFRKERPDDRAHVEGIGSAGETGVNEVIKRGTVGKLYSDSRVALEMELIERLMSSISKEDDLATYGKDDVRYAVECGAVSHLLVTDEVFRKANASGKGDALDGLMEDAAKKRGDVVIVSSEHEGGRRLDGLGGIAALLRYPLSREE